ncbi:MAG TPA: hypothetical protein EYP93_03140, partial [Gammaproteobacteria bacterium]|nr:hypothetical protein [Gammaproteobacteria bacterium]
DFDLTIYDINHPAITTLSPSTGSVNGGYQVEITGENFESGATVKFGVYTATDVTWNSATSMTVTVPANVPGYADITIINALTSDGITPQGTLTDGFEYTGSPLNPVISSISPDFGDYTGSTEVTITGDYLIDGLTTALGSNTLSSVTVVDAKTIHATVQSVPRGVHTVTVSNPNGASSSIVNAFESTLTEIVTPTTTTFSSNSPIQDSISVSEDIRMSEIYVHVNFSTPDSPGVVNLTLETPSGEMFSLFDLIKVAKNPWQDGWKTDFDVIFGKDEAPSEGLYRLKGESSLGTWKLHAESTSSSTSTVHSWGLSFFEFRHRDFSEVVYCAAEYRNHVMAVDTESGEILFKSRYEGAYGNSIAVSNDGRLIFSGGSTYHDGNSWENSLLYVYDAWTGEIVDSYLLSGRLDSGSTVQTPDGSLVVVTSTNLYRIDITNKTISENVTLDYFSNYNNYDVSINPNDSIVYLANHDASLVQTYSLPGLVNQGNYSTGLYSPTDIIISSDGSFGAYVHSEDIVQLFHTSNMSIYQNISVDVDRGSFTFDSTDTAIYGGFFSWDGYFSRVDLTTGLVSEHDVDGATFGTYSKDNRIYVSDHGDASIIVWDSTTNSQISQIDLVQYDGYSCRDITASEPPGLLSPNISASTNSLTLSWTAPSSGPAVTEYVVYKGDSPGNESFYSTVSSSTLTYTDTSASSTALSYYRVSSVMTGLGEGPISPRMTGAPGADYDNDGIADTLDDDDDNDGVLDSDDAFPLDPNEDTDTDGDGTGNNADTDDDGDGVDDSSDAFPLDSSEDTDTDGDGTGNNADTDDDGDGWSDDDEAICSTNPIDSNSVPSDTDSDGICDEVDSDRAEPGFQAGSVFTYATLSAGGGSTCAILDNGSLQCWGSNAVGKLGDGSSTNRATPTAANLGAGRTAVASAVGFYTSCSILDDGSVKCWGQRNGGSSGSTVSIGTGRIAVAIAVGFDHACAILDNASLICWGGNSAGQLGDGTTTTSSSPVSVDLGAGRTAAAIATGQAHTCVILDNASLMCWGSNSHGQLGDGTTTDSSTPVSVDVGAGRYAVAISGGRYQSCAILDDGSVKCWGYNGYGGLGDGTYTISGSPSTSVDLGTGRTAVSIATGYYHTCAVLDDASLKCWGYGNNGELGDGSTSSSNTPTSVTFDAGRSVLAIAHGSAHTCAMLDNMSVQCWGSNSAGQIGDGTTTDSTTPTYVSLASGGKVAVSERDLDGDGTLNILDTHMAGDNDGDGVVDTNDDYLNNPARWISCPSGSYGRFTCTDSIAGHNVPNAGSLLHTSQLECSIGTYQPSTGQSSCTDASAGYYVDSTAATAQTACAAGTYQPSTGQSSCLVASPGYYVPDALTYTDGFESGNFSGLAWLNDDQAGGTDVNGDANWSVTSSESHVGVYSAMNNQTDDGEEGVLEINLTTVSGYVTWNQKISTESGYDYLIFYVDYSVQGYWSGISGWTSESYYVTAGEHSFAWVYDRDSTLGGGMDTVWLDNVSFPAPVPPQTDQTPCPAGTYNPSTGSTNSSTCLDTDAGYYAMSTGSASQTACEAGTYQPSTGQVSCTYALAGYYVDTTAATSQIACNLGTYQPSTGQTACDDADAGYYVSTTAATSQTACAAGTYQPSTAQSSCIDTSAGYYVDTTAATSQIACDPGTYQPSTGQTSCDDADAGYYVSTTAAASQTACAAGTYQPSTAQSSCIDASAGYYVDTTAATSQTACPAGTYNPNTGSSDSSACINADEGYYVPNAGSTSQTPCSQGTYQSDEGQTSCDEADAGYYVNTTAATAQTACNPGTYQPSTGQASCIDASTGYYVPNSASSSQTACVAGTYQPNGGSTSCYQASAGYYVSSIASTNQTACSPGAYQPNQAQTSCLDTDAGYYVNTTAATAQTACNPGTYQPSTGQTSCIGASPGYNVDSYASASQTACSPGTYQPNNASSSCYDASPGYYVPTTGAINQTACSPETYQPSTGQTGCIDSSPGYYVAANASTVQTPCAIGHYQPYNGSSSCYEAEPGHYVSFQSAINQTACEAGTYNPSNGSISSDDCIETSPGNFTPVAGMPYQIGCYPGTYTPLTGQTSCMPADAGHYVDSNGSTTQTECSLGTYQPSTGRDSCREANPGYYVDSTAATSQTACEAGTYNPDNASTSHDSCMQADPGHYTGNDSMPYQIPCPVGT